MTRQPTFPTTLADKLSQLCPERRRRVEEKMAELIADEHRQQALDRLYENEAELGLSWDGPDKPRI